ncbi:MAG: murein biosynthesis integral membrane protein MurJ [Gemmatimonas sp.]|nr:murein biosynthesis integral membrane protein MurJ [Gemmatimonas sp.]
MRRGGGGAALVAAGILLSRLFGLVRNRLLGHFLGTSDAGDAFNAALRIPNVLQNLFGEGVLSASFIPTYSRLLADGDDEEAGRVAGAVGTLLALTTAVLVLVGIVLTPYLVALIAPGFSGEKRELTIRLVQVMFPGVGLLVLAAWALGVLNSHRRFFLPYASPVAMNVVMIGALLWFGPSLGNAAGQARLVVLLAWASVLGSATQLVVQLPTVLRVERRLRLGLGTANAHVRVVLSQFAPVALGRGVVQVSAYVDSLLASLVGAGAVAVLSYAQVITMLPVSLFGMSVSAAELPAMAGAVGTSDEVARELRRRLSDGLHRIAFYVIPSSMAFAAIGDIVGATLYQSGRFGRDDVVWMWGVLAGSAVGLLAATLGRMYASTWYALRNTRTPLKFAMLRVALGLTVGWLVALKLPGLLGIDARWGVAGLTASSGLAAWVECLLLRRSLVPRIGDVGVDRPYQAKLWGAAASAALAAWGVKLVLGVEHPLVLGFVALPLYGLVYLGATASLGVPEASAMAGRIRRLAGGR